MKIILFLTLLLFNANLFAQNDSLYDVNYDRPESPMFENQRQSEFQEIYLQYEEAIHNIEKKVRAEEVKKKLEEIEKLKAEFLQQTEREIQQARKEMYAAEAAAVREQETVRLSDEITEALTQKLSKEFEEKKNAEIAALTDRLRREVSEENRSTTQRILIISKYVFYLLLIALVILILYKMIKLLVRKKEKQRIKKLELRQWTDSYSKHLEDKKNYFTVEQEVQENIGKNPKEKELHLTAFQEAKRKTYQKKSVADIEKALEDYRDETDNNFELWNGQAKDEETMIAVYNEFDKKRKDYYVFGKGVVESFDSREKEGKNKLIKLLNTHGEILVQNGNKIEEIILPNCKKTDLRENFKKLVEEYRQLGKQFKEAKF